MTTAIKLVSAVWLLSLAGMALRRCVRRPVASVYVLVVAHAFFFGLPLALDLIVGPVQHTFQPAFALANADFRTLVVYSVYVSLCPLLWLWLGVPRNYTAPSTMYRLAPRFGGTFRRACVAALPLPLLIAASSPAWNRYLDYAVPIRGLDSELATDWHTLLSTTTVLCVLAAASLVSEAKTLSLTKWITLLGFITLSCWLNGKRAIVAIAIAVIGYALWSRGVLRGRRLRAAVLLGVSTVFSFSFFYQSRVRYLYDIGPYAEFQGIYDKCRIDFFRDDRLKMTLFAELYPTELQILDHRGQSMLFYATFFVPRSLWPDKPWPYATYFTSAMLRLYPPRPLGWGMTTSWLEEAIANFGWLGTLIAPLSLLILCRVGDSFRWASLSMLTSLAACLLLAVEAVAFMTVLVLWASLVFLLLLRSRPAHEGRFRLMEPCEAAAMNARVGLQSR